jgi:nucleotide-binding universal stress UspA family protein
MRSAPSAATIVVVSVFDIVVCGIDESPEGLEALRQAERLRPPSSRLHLLTAAERALAVHAGWGASGVLEQIEAGARDALARALERAAADTTSRLVDGNPTECLLREAESEHATLLAVGSHGQSRIAGIILGGTATALLHSAPCSVLVARRPRVGLEFPAAVVVGLDGSTESRRALEIARDLGARLDVPVRSLAASGGKPVAWDGLRDVEGLEWSEQQPVTALVEASAGADLLVLGSRGLHGLASLGSVSERVASRAHSSVLVVRDSRR